MSSKVVPTTLVTPFDTGALAPQPDSVSAGGRHSGGADGNSAAVSFAGSPLSTVRIDGTIASARHGESSSYDAQNDAAAAADAEPEGVGGDGSRERKPESPSLRFKTAAHLAGIRPPREHIASYAEEHLADVSAEINSLSKVRHRVRLCSNTMDGVNTCTLYGRPNLWYQHCSLWI